jgi:hypothetical protein
MRNKTPTSDQIEENDLTLLASAVVSWDWRGSTTFKDSKPACNISTIKRVLSELPWFRKQIDEALGDTKNFFTE